MGERVDEGVKVEVDRHMIGDTGGERIAVLRASCLLKVLNRVAGRISECAFVRRKWYWARWVYCMRLRGGTPASASKAV